MTEIESGDVQAMRDEAFVDLLDEMNAKRQQLKLASVFGWGLSAVGLLLAFIAGQVGFWFLILAIPGWIAGRWLDSYRRRVVLFYEFEREVEQRYRTVVEAFDHLSSCTGKWHVQAGGAVKDLKTWKRNAGATHIVRKTPTALAYKLPNEIVSNVTPPALHVGKQVIYFLPDVALIEDGKRFGAVGYADLQINWQDSNFIEEGRVPSDAQIVSHTWKHPNKSGGPDRRFRNNYQIPVCRYEAMHMISANGVNELVEFSRTGMVQPFANALSSMPSHSRISKGMNARRGVTLR